jgi:hypothetical protein
MTTTRTLVLGLVIALIASIPVWQMVMEGMTSVFPFGWAGAGLTYMSVFFHEIGHTVFMWFYGYPTFPMFDFEHGGGLAYSPNGQQPFLVGCVWILLASGIFYFKEYRFLQVFFGVLLFLNFLTVWNEDWHRSVFDFMGPAFEALVASFLLFRALFNLAPEEDSSQKNLERVLNAAFGFGMIFRLLIDAYGLLENQGHRLAYYSQKGMHGFGDFDKIASRFYGLTFDGVVYMWIALALLCLILPFAAYLITLRNERE